TRIKLQTLAKGQLMVRHPHFTQPIFVKFPRPPVMRGRDGAERWPQASDASLDVAMLRSLRRLDPSLTLTWVQDVIALHDEREVIRVRNACLIARPQNVKEFFAAQLRSVVPARQAPSAPRAIPIRALPDDDPYGF
ncbi:MAG TPA: hypothetical protein VJ596_02675, partial [Gemmatimonadaceae bacterium]|nr:hypothetical protein [Gemmatimonadaceae bacterium]